MFLASENIDFTGLSHVFLLGGGERRVIIFTHGDWIVHIPGMNTGFLVMKPAIAVFTPQTASSAQPYYQQPSAEIALT